MDIKALRDKAAQATAKASAIRDELKTHEGAWPAEKQQQFDAFVAEASGAMSEIQRLERLDTLETFFTRPAGDAPKAGAVQSAKSISEAFSAYRIGGKLGVEVFARQNGLKADELYGSCTQIHKEAFHAYLRGERPGLFAYAAEQQHVNPRELHALVSNDDSLGGFMVPDDFQAEVVRASVGFAAIRPLARIVNTNRDTLVYPKIAEHGSDSRYPSGFAGDWKAQASVTSLATTQDKPTFKQERIPVHTWRPDPVQVSEELLEDSAANVEQILAQIMGETKAIDEDDKFLEGTGLGEPEGIVNAGITTVASGSASTITYGGLIDLFVAVPAQYRQRSGWMMNSGTYGAILKLTDTAGNYVIQPNTLPGTLWGKSIAFHEGMDACTTASNKPIIFGDFQRYIIAERKGLSIKRLVESYHPNIAFAPVARLGGQVVLIDAFRIMTVSAS